MPLKVSTNPQRCSVNNFKSNIQLDTIFIKKISILDMMQMGSTEQNYNLQQTCVKTFSKRRQIPSLIERHKILKVPIHKHSLHKSLLG